jgi:hypothetical protein
MNWIDLSGMETPENLPSTWTFHSLKGHMSDEETARCGETILLTMYSNNIEKGKVAAVRDHVNLSGKNPLRGHNNDELGVRFPDMSHPYAIPEGYNGDTVVIRAGQNEDHPFDAVEAAEMVYQTILAKHQMKKVYALVYGENVQADDLIKIITGE